MNNQSLFLEKTAIAKKQYEELLSLCERREIEAVNNITDEGKKSRATDLLWSLIEYIRQSKDVLGGSINKQLPVIEMADSHIQFVQELLTDEDRISNAFWQSFFGLSNLFGETTLDRGNRTETQNVKRSKRSERYKNALDHLVEFWVETLSEGEREEYEEFVDTCEELKKVIHRSWFDPDQWEERSLLLKPIMVPPGTSDKLRDHVRVRIYEIYRSFIFGQYMACIALSRTLVEFIMYQNANKLGVVKDEFRDSEKSLYQIIKAVKEGHPKIAELADFVRESGNRVIHPKKRSVISIPRVLQSEALETIENAIELVETIYGR